MDSVGDDLLDTLERNVPRRRTINPFGPPFPGRPKNITQFTRQKDGQPLTDQQRLKMAERQGKLNQKLVDRWSSFINNSGKAYNP
jgi:hypothetical protein